MKKFSSVSLAAVLLLTAACTPAADTGTTGDSVSSSSAMLMPSSAQSTTASSVMADDAASSAAASAAITAGARVITMTVTDFAFSPNVIRVQKGEAVVVRITAVNGTHGFGSTDLGLNVRIEPGQTKDIVIPTAIAGTFAFKCTVPCGSGHRDMTGTIIIEE